MSGCGAGYKEYVFWGKDWESDKALKTHSHDGIKVTVGENNGKEGKQKGKNKGTQRLIN